MSLFGHFEDSPSAQTVERDPSKFINVFRLLFRKTLTASFQVVGALFSRDRRNFKSLFGPSWDEKERVAAHSEMICGGDVLCREFVHESVSFS